jgi:hypothetical protein
MAIDFHDVIPASISGGDGQEPGGLDIPRVRDEQEAVAVVNPADRAMEAVGVLEAGSLEGDGRRPSAASALRRWMATRRYIGAAVALISKGAVLERS